ncbi:MAG: glycosyltransferase family 4 protein [Patescibacteria group bacterium]
MRIAQVASNFYAVSPNSNRGIYSHVAYLTDHLVDHGHQVSLYAAGNSVTKAKLEYINKYSVAKMAISDNLKRNYLNLLLSKCYKNSDNFDIIHAHFTLLSSFYSYLAHVPTVQSIHSPIDSETKKILKFFKNNNYISFSLAQRKLAPELNWVANIYHGLDLKKFAFNPNPKDYFLYLGRITEEKGVHLAIEAAKGANVKLIIAGTSYSQEGYWHEKIEKNIDGETIKYVGEAGLEEKIKYLKNAKAVLFPTQYNESFGLVMIEAMSCGTPVIGWRNGAVPEVISHCHSGYIVKSVADMVKAINKIDKISREETRKRAETYFSVGKMVTGYEKVYAKIIEEYHQKNIEKNN